MKQIKLTICGHFGGDEKDNGKEKTTVNESLGTHFTSIIQRETRMLWKGGTMPLFIGRDWERDKGKCMYLYVYKITPHTTGPHQQSLVGGVEELPSDWLNLKEYISLLSSHCFCIHFHHIILTMKKENEVLT